MASPTRSISAALSESFIAMIRDARLAWPEIDVPEDEFARRVDEAQKARPVGAGALLAAPLWLAVACARGDVKALRAFEALTFGGARAALVRMGLSADAIGEVLQMLREKLFVAEAGEAPRILAMAAHGDLPGVVRVAAVRTALNHRRKDHRIDDDGDRLIGGLCAADDPETLALKEEHRAALESAIVDALATLTVEERNVLRMHLLHGLSIDAIGRSYQVHRATAARWLAAIRDKLDRESRKLVRARKGLTDPEFDSLVRLVESRIHVSFSRVLAAAR